MSEIIRCRGLDVAQPQAKVLPGPHYEAQVDWRRARDEGGNVFALVKLTQGTKGIDPVAFAHLDGAREAKLLVGAYHFLDEEDPAAQARHFVDQINRYASATGPGALPHWVAIDDEVLLAKGIAPAEVVRRVRVFEDEVRLGISEFAVIVYYSFASYVQRLGTHASELAYLPLHLAKYTGLGDPADEVPAGFKDWDAALDYDTPTPANWGKPWTFLQYIGGFWQAAKKDAAGNLVRPGRAVGGRCPGVPGVVDKNLFRGTYSDLWDFCQLPGPAPKSINELLSASDPA